MVQGSGFRGLRLGVMGSMAFQIIDESPNGRTGTAGMIAHLLELLGPNVSLIQSHIKPTLRFGAGSFGIPQKSEELRIGLGIEPLAMLGMADPAASRICGFDPPSLANLEPAVNGSTGRVNSWANCQASIPSNLLVLIPLPHHEPPNPKPLNPLPSSFS
jgi:hypothetical protein